MKHRIRTAFIIGLLMLVLHWGVSIIRCEYLTHKYAQEFLPVVLEEFDPARLHKIKVLDYDGKFARVYYVLDYYGTDEPGYGFLAELLNGERTHVDDCVWSYHGSADDYIWPYGR